VGACSAAKVERASRRPSLVNGKDHEEDGSSGGEGEKGFEARAHWLCGAKKAIERGCSEYDDSAPVAEDAVTGEQAGKGSGEGLKRTGRLIGEG